MCESEKYKTHIINEVEYLQKKIKKEICIKIKNTLKSIILISIKQQILILKIG